ncbi:MAG: AMP-binding protein [Methylibium sp.]|uniref:acyl-CoA synthetase n=1 Tax=Methylibium sp. TaxID=2067992 RepID=UPI0017A18B3D|nr:AMP-binding protein [Methylibium sp.]MBA3596577.1 AMP-binding protein [Methylibium sp.]
MTETTAAATAADHHEDLHRRFRWQVPPLFNLAEACCGRWARDAATRERTAIVHEAEDGRIARVSYAELQAEANRLAHALERAGLQRGDRVALVLPQRPETAIAHIAIQQVGAVAMPLSMLFGPEALEYRLHDSAARLAIVDAGALANLRAARPACPQLVAVLVVGGDPGAAAEPGEVGWQAALQRESPVHAAVTTQAGDGAILIYTSGTTGPPKGALLPQRALLGNLPGFVCSQNGFDGAWRELWPGLNWLSPARGSGKGAGPLQGQGPGGQGQDTQSVFWSPADWAWTGGLMDALLPTLYFGRTVVGTQGRFDPLRAFELMQRHGVTHSFLFPTALKAMMKAAPAPRERYALQLRALMSAGEAVGDAVFAWVRQALGLTVNEMFGQTEINYIVGNCAGGLTVENGASGEGQPGWPARAGSMGRAYPGHRIAVIDDAGEEVPRGTPGDVALHRRDVHGERDPIFFLGYWNNDAATRAKFTGDADDSWCRTGDTASMDADGYLWYLGRSDDVFKVAGYRIGPSEIENCLVKHPAVANAAVVPKPDAERGALVKAYVVLASGVQGDAALVEALQQHVRGRLAPYEYPKEIEFIDALPMTTTGKLQRRVLRLQEEVRARAAAGQG